MICPNCRSSVSDDIPFCPVCGQNLSAGRTRRKLRFVLMDIQDDRRFRHLASAIIIVVMVMAFLSVLLTPMGGGDDPSPSVVPSEDAVQIPGTGYYVEFYDGFGDGGFRAEPAANGQLCIRLSSSVSGAYTGFSWVLHNDATGQNMVVIKDTAEIYWASPSPGRYTVTVECDSSSETFVHVGRMVCFGDVSGEHIFAYGGNVYSVKVDVPLDEYLQHSSYEGPRSSSSAEDAASFAEVGGSVRILAQRLGDAFISVNPSKSTTGAEFAAFVTAFVGSCIDYASDSAVYSRSVYWAYPSETLYNGVGDSGDRAVLLAAILKASGYSAGVVLMHGAVFAAASIDGYDGPSDAPDGTHVVTMGSDGRMYLLIDASEGAMFGTVPDQYDIRGGRFYYYGSETRDAGGFAAVRSTRGA